MTKIIGSILLVCLSFKGHTVDKGSGTACENTQMGPHGYQKAAQMSEKVLNYLEKKHAKSQTKVVLLGRAGSNSPSERFQKKVSQYWNYTHAGLAYRNHPDGMWTIIHLLNDCGKTSSIYAQSMMKFFMDDPYAYRTVIGIPSIDIQNQLETIIIQRNMSKAMFNNSVYSSVSNPFNTQRQNSNEYILDTLVLAYAYEQGDLSRVYPIARGAAPMMVLAFSLVFLTDPIAMMDYVGIVVLGLGIALMARGVFANNESRGLLPFAFGSACATAGYTLVDGLGARVSGDPIGFTGWLLIMAALFYIPSVVALKGRCVLRASVRTWAVIGIAGVASYLAYAIVVWAMTQAPIALVAALRETSILFAVLIGWLVFGEKMDRGKAIASVLIVVGAVLTRL